LAGQPGWQSEVGVAHCGLWGIVRANVDKAVPAGKVPPHCANLPMEFRQLPRPGSNQ